MTSTNWESPQRQSPAAIFIILIRASIGLLKAFWPVLIFYVIPRPPKEDEVEAAAEASRFGGFFWFSLAFVAIAVLLALLRYFYYKFSVVKAHLEIHSGFFRQQHLSIPLQNIQAVHLEQGLWQRSLGVYRVAFDSTGSEQMEARIDALPKTKALALKDFISQHISQDKPESPQNQNEQEDTRSNKLNYRLDGGDLLKLSLSANHLEAFALLMAFGLQLYDDIEPLLQGTQKQALEQYAYNANQLSLWLMASLLLMLALISIVVSAGRTLLKYYDFRLEEEGKGWRLSFGLITRHQRFTPISKIQQVNYRANWLRRKINLWIVTLDSVGQEKNTRAELKLSLPTSSRLQADVLASYYLDVRSFTKTEQYKISSAYWQRASIWLLGIFGTAALALGYWLHIAAGLASGGIMLYGIWHFYYWQQNFRWTINMQGLYMKSGVWGRKYTLLRWEKIQELEFRQSLYQKRRNLASLRFRTAGGELYLPFLDQEVAEKVRDYALYRLESKKAAWL